MMTTRKKILLIACALSTNVCFANKDNVVSNVARGAGDALGTFAGSAVNALIAESVPSSEFVAVETAVGDDFNLEARDSSHTKQTSVDIEVDSADIQFVYANTQVVGDTVMVMENCTDGCFQAIHDILVNSGGRGFTRVYANTVVDGEVRMRSLNSPNSEQSQVRVRIKN